MISVVVPVYNEEDAVLKTLTDLVAVLDGIGEFEIIAVDDGSTDASLDRITSSGVSNLRIVTHAHNLGYGKSLLDGISVSAYDCIAIIDGDGSYPSDALLGLLEHYPQYDMIVGARTGHEYTKGVIKRPARRAFKFLVEYVTGKEIPDINSGLRVFRKDLVTRFQSDMCTGFSFTTNLTLLAFLNHYFVKYVPIDYHPRAGLSKVRHFRDTLRATQIIVQSALYYNPLKLFLLAATGSFAFGIMLGALDYLLVSSTFLAVLAALMVGSVLPLFCLGLVADLIRRSGIPREDIGRLPNLMSTTQFDTEENGEQHP